MAIYQTAEYQHLLKAEQALHAVVQDKETSPKDIAAAARVLVQVIDQKRTMRMLPKPKQVDVSKLQKRQRSTPKAGQEPFTVPEPSPAAQPMVAPAATTEPTSNSNNGQP